jgi:hypothetical protein
MMQSLGPSDTSIIWTLVNLVSRPSNVIASGVINGCPRDRLRYLAERPSSMLMQVLQLEELFRSTSK